MAKAQKMTEGEVITVTGNISFVSPLRHPKDKSKKGGEFININIALDSKTGTEYFQLTFSGLASHSRPFSMARQ